jgi:REP element-mobilizing transposase RayT
MDSQSDNIIKKSWEEYEKMKTKIVELEAEIDRLRAILEPPEDDYDYDKCTGKFHRALLTMMRKESEERAKRVRVTNTYGFKNE